MSTDIVRSTDLLQVVSDDAWNSLLRWHDSTLSSLFSSHGGEEVKRTGDGFFVAFERPEAAVQCAIEIQRTLLHHRAEHGFAPAVRIGIHEAEATRRGDDYQGHGVHEAARIAALAAGGEIVASDAVTRSLDPATVSEPRALMLKGLSEPIEVVSISWR
jgi:class 3 adenylate cyclase